MAADIATPDLLARLKSLYPLATDDDESSNSSLLHQNPWYIVAAVAFSASNLPEAVPLVFQYALDDLRAHSARSAQQGQGTSADSEAHEDEFLLVRRIKDAVFKAGIINGYPKAINALVALHQVVPAHLQDRKPLRDVTLSTDEYLRQGQALFDQTYGKSAESVQGLLDSSYPDLGFFCMTYAYGFTYSFSGLSPKASWSARETSYTMIAALIASDTPRQIGWHLAGAQRNGASVEQVRAVREMAMMVAKAAGVHWKGDVPDVVVE